MSHRASAIMVAFALTLPMILAAETPSKAALPPPYEHWRIFRLIIENNDIPTRLYDHGSVDRIERRKDGTYRVWAGKCHVPITLTVIPFRGEPGQLPPPGTSTQYTLNLGVVKCR